MNWYEKDTVEFYVAALCEHVKASTSGHMVVLATIDPESPRYKAVLKAVQDYMNKGNFQQLQPQVKDKILRKWMETGPETGGLGIRNPALQTEILNQLGVNIAGTQVMPTSREFKERAQQQQQQQSWPAGIRAPQSGPNLMKEWGPGGSAVPQETNWRIPRRPALQPA